MWGLSRKRMLCVVVRPPERKPLSKLDCSLDLVHNDAEQMVVAPFERAFHAVDCTPQPDCNDASMVTQFR